MHKLAIALLMLYSGAMLRAEVTAPDVEPPPEPVNATVHVDDYTAAANRLTWEIARRLRENRLLVMWAIDESASMHDDRLELAKHVGRIFDELGIFGRDDDPPLLQHVVIGFGPNVHVQTERPESSAAEVIRAIKRVPDDTSGQERVFEGVYKTLQRFGPIARRLGRQTLIVIVTDEAGDDGEHLEQTLQMLRQSKAAVYVLGRESVFGRDHATIRWKSPRTDDVYAIPIRRGPETAFPEVLQTDGFGPCDANVLAGFGPYTLSRLVNETGGLFLALPDDALSQDEAQRRADAPKQLREYAPELAARREYETQRRRSRFRAAIGDAIASLDPQQKSGLDVAEYLSPVADQEWTRQIDRNLDAALKLRAAAEAAVAALEKVASLRDAEASRRWQANYDLLVAECLALQVRMEHVVAVLVDHREKPPRTDDAAERGWTLTPVDRPRVLSPAARARLNVKPGDLERQTARAKERLQQVAATHPHTPWARRAETWLDSGLGIELSAGRFSPLDPEDADENDGVPRM
ncbi:MAG: VWA domain-containing protein [Planctomycetes bacterium]|nr:VWA domain-containing protein [Planctomycetota bacterium]